jgi:hypothetical protein
VLLIDASSDTTLTSDLANFAQVKNIGKTDKDALHWFVSHRENWLLIFDNADDINMNLGAYFPRTNHGNIIITTRNQSTRNHTAPSSSFDVSQMGPADATDLLLKVAGLDSENKSTAAEFAQASDLLTLYENFRADGYVRNLDVTPSQ